MEGETLGLVGESGCGKSTTARTVLQLLPATSGSVRYRGTELTGQSRKQLRPMRQHLQVVFQDPYASLDPRMPVGEIVAEPLRVHGRWDRKTGPERVDRLFELVGLNPEHRNRFPHEFSGGQRQRVGVARALALDPKVLVLDEPVSALDVSIQAGVVNLLEELQDRLGLAYLFIAHDLSVVRHICDRVAVMYLGKIVEIGTGTQVYETPVAPLHAGPAVGGAGAGPGHRAAAAADPAHRGRAECRHAAVRVPVPYPVLEGAGDLRAGGTDADRARSGPSRGLPLRRRHPGHPGRVISAGPGGEPLQLAWLTEDMLKPSTRSGGIAVRLK